MPLISTHMHGRTLYDVHPFSGRPSSCTQSAFAFIIVHHWSSGHTRICKQLSQRSTLWPLTTAHCKCVCGLCMFFHISATDGVRQKGVKAHPHTHTHTHTQPPITCTDDIHILSGCICIRCGQRRRSMRAPQMYWQIHSFFGFVPMAFCTCVCRLTHNADI